MSSIDRLGFGGRLLLLVFLAVGIVAVVVFVDPHYCANAICTEKDLDLLVQRAPVRTQTDLMQTLRKSGGSWRRARLDEQRLFPPLVATDDTRSRIVSIFPEVRHHILSFPCGPRSLVVVLDFDAAGHLVQHRVGEEALCL